MVKEYPNILFYLDLNSTLSGLAALQEAQYRAFHDRLFKFKPFGLGITPPPPPFGGSREGADGKPVGPGDSLLLPRLGEVGRGPMACSSGKSHGIYGLGFKVFDLGY